VFDDTTKVIRALEYNANLCKKAIDKKLGVFVAAIPCALGENGHGIPPSTAARIPRASSSRNPPVTTTTTSHAAR
jgi:hypothetical protein